MVVEQEQQQVGEQTPFSHKERVQFFIEEVLHWPAYKHWFALREDTFIERKDVSYPMCYWYDDGGWIVERTPDGDSRPFDPYKSLDDAWELLESDDMDGLREVLLGRVRWWEIEKESLCREICDAASMAVCVRKEAEKDEREREGTGL